MDRTTLETVVKVENLYKCYKGIVALNNISFSINKGEVFGLIGPDGSGKTSIIQILAGVLKPDLGKAFLNDIDVVKKPDSVKDIIGYMPQGLGLNLYDSLTIDENIEFFKGLRLIPDEIFKKNKKILLEITRLEPFLQRQVKKLSGGMRQKLALICTLLHLPDIILLDEPTTGVDPLSRQDFWNIIHGLVKERNVTVFLTTSYMDEAERCHRVALMHEGKILLQGKPDELGDLEEVFIKEVSGKKIEFFSLNKIGKKVLEDKPIIYCNSITKIFGRFKAVDSVTIIAFEGEIIGLLGPNGAGKTTLIKMMCGLLELTEGSINIAGFDVKKEKKKVWSIIGYMSQKFSLYRDLSVVENMKLFAGLYGVRTVNFSEIINLLGLTELEDRMTKDLPLGIRQRVALACALLHKPPVLFLDEPTSGVDPIARRNFWKIIYELSRLRGVTIIVSTHYMDEAENCDRLCLMHHGKVITQGTPAEIKKGSEKISGTLFQIKSVYFNKIYDSIIKEFPNISIYGNKILVRSFEPEVTLKRLKTLLKESMIENYEINQTDIPLQEAFVDYIKASDNA